ncbi:Protein MB21D2 [Dufourea novaeangliae]|uniref:Protein MB21D2 n=1 Tax=Dufourea novaeangliae TaxID=178035 RepID=A0A154PF63_DUFNO|nr:Protein MB21D2 [Dufourea novaeangliae]
MGNSKSRNRSGSRGKVSGKTIDNSSSQEDDYEDIELRLLRRMIQTSPDRFVLNNLMMCVQFFKNYEEDIEHVKGTLVSSAEAELNKHLPQQKHVLLPDVLQEHIARNVGFTSTTQISRPTIEPLQPVRIYTVHDNIDITEPNYLSHYSSMNNSDIYNILLKTTEHEGFVQLQLIDNLDVSKDGTIEEDVDLSSIAEDNDQLYSDGDSVYSLKPRSNLILPRRSRQGMLKGSKYGYATSLPNLLAEEEILYEDRRVLSRSNRNIQDETDYENDSSVKTEKTNRSKRTSYKTELLNGEHCRCEKYSTQTKIHGSANESRTSSISSGYRSDNYTIDSDSSLYPTQNDKHGQTSIYELRDECCIRNDQLPNRCFKRVTYTSEGKLYDPREERKQPLNSKQRRIKQALIRHNYDLFYASSTEFMRHFVNVFLHRLADCFGFDRESIEDAKREGCVLYCDKITVSNALRHSRVEQYEIIPAVWLEWPSCGQEWLDRSRSTWPDYTDVEKIKASGCYVVPEGFVPRRETSNNLNEDLEWQLTFPNAERYLETCMTHAQVQVYLISLVVHKTFMRPVYDSFFGLTIAHIRHKLFWLIEENDRPSKWPDNRMGDCLLSFLNSLYYCISQNEPTLRDYFVRGRNLFQRVPYDHLLHTQKQLKRIIENPVMYVFHAMENIRHNENFFPRLDFETLLRILTADTLTLINPAVVRHVSRPLPRSSAEISGQEEKYGTGGFWDVVKNQRKKHSTTIVTNKTLINPRKATDSIIEISTRCAELDGPRLCALLDFFIRHFIKMADRCNQYRAIQQKTTYLDQADRLSILLFEHQRYKQDARAYRDKIKVLRKRNAGSRPQEDPPETPRRNPEAAIFVAPLKHRFARESFEHGTTVPETEDEQSRKASEQSVSSIRNTTKVIIHEGQYKEPEAQELSIPKNRTTPASPARETTKSRKVVMLLEPSETKTNESTNI